MKMYLEENQAVRARYQEKEIKKLIRSEFKKMKNVEKDKEIVKCNDGAPENKSAI